MKLADRVRNVGESATMAVSNKARALQNDGVDVVDLSVGEPDFRTPANIRQAGQEAIEAGHTTYTPARGIHPLRQAIVEKLAADGIQCSTDEIVVTPGAKHALYVSVQTLVDDGGEVVLLDPAWVSYEPMATLAGGTTTRVDLAPYEFRLEPALDDLAEVLSDSTRLLMVNSPNNPTGRVYSDAALRGVRDLAVDHDVAVIADEIYQRVAYERTPTSLASLDGMAERTVTINGMSKAYSMTGWRLGYLAGPARIVDDAAKVQSHSVSCATNFVQRAGIEALENSETAVEEMRSTFEERRDALLERLATAGHTVSVPEGAFYLMLPVADDDQAWCERALEEAHVATVPGSAFGAPGYARLSYAASRERVLEGVERLLSSDLL
ncbi:MAG: pyridoxal phosphate-dependent aminotransferase [Halobacteriaceae archaeon]